MSNYLGYECIVCKKKFDENDDIVVCPDCGTPYHRECYAEEGRCINEKLHESGECWKAPESGDAKSEYKKCQYCNKMNKPHTIICEQCGAPLVEELDRKMAQGNSKFGGFDNMNEKTFSDFSSAFGFDPRDKYCGMNREEEFESVKLKDLADFVGTNQMYYLPLFKRMKDTKRKNSFNIPAFFIPQLYFSYRKMWLWTILSTVITTVLSIPYIIVVITESQVLTGMIANIDTLSETFNLLYNVTSILNLLFQGLMLSFANWIYYKHSVKKIKRVKNVDESADVSSVGGTSIAGVLFAFAFQMALIMLIMMILTR